MLVADSLSSIEYTQSARLMGNLDNLLDGCDSAEDIRAACARDRLCTSGHLAQCRHVKIAVGIYPDTSKIRTALLAELLPGHIVGVMLKRGHNHRIARLYVIT